MTNIAAATTIMDNVTIQQVVFDRSRPFTEDDLENDNFESKSIFEAILDASIHSASRKRNTSSTTRSTDSRRKSPNGKAILLVGLVLVLVLAVVGTIVGVTTSKKRELNNPVDLNRTSSNSSTSDNNDRPTDSDIERLPLLQVIRDRGHLRCKPESLETQKEEGFTIDLVSWHCVWICIGSYLKCSGILVSHGVCFCWSDHFYTVPRHCCGCLWRSIQSRIYRHGISRAL